MAEPTNYDKLQDQRLDDLESLITAEYEPPEGTEYSFPVANQGITQEQFRLMFLGQANGMIHGDNGAVNDPESSTDNRYYLEGHDSDSETNQRNTLICVPERRLSPSWKASTTGSPKTWNSHSHR